MYLMLFGDSGLTGPAVSRGMSGQVEAGNVPNWTHMDWGRRRKLVVLTAALSLAGGPWPGRAAAPPTAAVSDEVNVIGASDVVLPLRVNGQRVDTCTPFKQVAQNETSIAVNPEDPDNLVMGANDYRLFVSKTSRFEPSGGVYRSTDGGRTWTVGLLPGVMRSSPSNPVDYDAAGDPAVAAGPDNTFWYANIIFNRDFSKSSLAVSRSTDGGATWTTARLLNTPGTVVLSDKEWIAANPQDPNQATLVWAAFLGAAVPQIVASTTVDGGVTWTPPTPVTAGFLAQGAVVQYDDLGLVHVVYSSVLAGEIVHAVSADGGRTFASNVVSSYTSVPSPLPGAGFRTNSFTGFSADPDGTLHVVWPNWAGGRATVMHSRSDDRGLTWTAAKAVVPGPHGDQFFAWVGSRAGKVFAVWLERLGSDDRYVAKAAGSLDGGAGWSAPVQLSSAVSDASRSNKSIDCVPFIGDYSGVAVGSDGVAHAAWTDARDGNSPGDPGTKADNDPYSARISLVP